MPTAGPARTVRTARTEEHGSFHAHSMDAAVGFALLRFPGHPAAGAHRGRTRLDCGAAGRNPRLLPRLAGLRGTPSARIYLERAAVGHRHCAPAQPSPAGDLAAPAG